MGWWGSLCRRIAETCRPLDVSRSTPCSRQGQLEQVAHDYVYLSFVSRDATPPALWETCSSAHTLTVILGFYFSYVTAFLSCHQLGQAWLALGKSMLRVPSHHLRVSFMCLEMTSGRFCFIIFLRTEADHPTVPWILFPVDRYNIFLFSTP